MYRVRIGPFDTMAQASAYRSRFEATEHMNTIVIRRRTSS
jgi:cell division protein FtsN